MILAGAYIVFAEYILENGFDHPNNDTIFRENTDRNACELLCDNDINCVGYVMSIDDPIFPTSSCWTKNALSKKIVNKMRQTYIKKPKEPVAIPRVTAPERSTPSPLIPLVIPSIVKDNALVKPVVPEAIPSAIITQMVVPVATDKSQNGITPKVEAKAKEDQKPTSTPYSSASSEKSTSPSSKSNSIVHVSIVISVILFLIAGLSLLFIAYRVRKNQKHRRRNDEENSTSSFLSSFTFLSVSRKSDTKRNDTVYKIDSYKPESGYKWKSYKSDNNGPDYSQSMFADYCDNTIYSTF